LIRELLTGWCDELDDEYRQRIIGRFHSRSDREFHSAFFELYLHSLLVRSDHKVLHEPHVPASARRPDFLAIDGNSTSAIIEAKVVTEQSDDDLANDARINALYDAINDRVQCLDFYLSLEIFGSSETPFPLVKWCGMIQRWADDLNYDAVAALGAQELFDELPRLDLCQEDLVLVIQPIAKNSSTRGKAGARPIGVQGSEGEWATSHLEVSKALKEKATRYGVLNQPYIVAINCLGPMCDFDDVHEGIFGADGLWPRSRPDRFTRVSAVLAMVHLLPWSVPRTAPVLMHNPNAAFPYAGPLTKLPQIHVEGKSHRYTLGLHPRELFELEECWPKCGDTE